MADTENSQTIHVEADCPRDRGCRWKVVVAILIVIVGAGAAVGGFLAGLTSGAA